MNADHSSNVRLRLIPALLIFLSSYFPLSIILIIKDFDICSHRLLHPIVVASVAVITLGAYFLVIAAAHAFKAGVPVRITRVANKPGEMFAYTVPYIISFYNFNLGDFKMVLCLLVFMSLMFTLSYKTQNMMVNPILALSGYGFFDCQFHHAGRDLQGEFISKIRFQPGDTCVVEQLSDFLYFVAKVIPKEGTNSEQPFEAV